jgi:alpha-tubulin suppressor-like RCC1 family protein
MQGRDGTLWAWGDNKKGCLGQGDAKKRTELVKFEFPGGSGSIEAFAFGDRHSLLLTKEGEVYAWGDNNYGQLGQGHAQELKKPTKVEGSWFGMKVRAIACGSYFSMAATEDGSVYVWGDNDCGQLGVGDTDNRFEPVKINIQNAEKIAGGCQHAVAITFSGELFVWGCNYQGQLGFENLVSRYHPEPHHLPDLDEVVCSAFHTIGRTKNGEVYVWGDNSHHELGLGDSRQRPVPVKLLDGVRSFASGEGHSLVLLEDGSVLAWGSNSSGQLGLGHVEEVVEPEKVSIPSESPVVAIMCGNSFSMVLTRVGKLYVWGNNKKRQLGGVASPHVRPEVTEPMEISEPIFKLPGSENARRWETVVSWIFLGISDQSSAFSVIPIEVLFHLVSSTLDGF